MLSYGHACLHATVLALAVLVGCLAGPAEPLLQGTDATLRILNESNQAICHVFIAPATASSWGKNWLGENTILAGEGHSFDLSSGQPITEDVVPVAAVLFGF